MTDWRANTRLIPDLEFVRAHIEASGQFLHEQHVNRTIGYLRSFPAESPIEAVFIVWWDALLKMRDITERVELHTQYAVYANGNPYRLDFVLLPPIELTARAHHHRIPWAHIGVELDGHEFHERTKEQVALRNRRDRDLSDSGWIVIHYAGSEINADPIRCVKEAFDRARRLFNDTESLVEAAERAADSEAGAQTSQES